MGIDVPPIEDDPVWRPHHTGGDTMIDTDRLVEAQALPILRGKHTSLAEGGCLLEQNA
jgi:hypothetical protein